MKMIKCDSCGTEMSPKAPTCPKCGHPNARSKHLPGSQVIIMLLAVGAGLWFFAGGGVERQAASDLRKIEDQVAADAVAQFQIAKRQGDKMQVCVQAGLVSAAYLQAKDESNYKQWKQTEVTACREAGVPR